MMTSPTQCPLCGTGRVVSITNQQMISLVQGCHCGPWELSDEDYGLHEIEKREDRWLLSAWLRNRHLRTGQPYRYSDRVERKLPGPLPEPTIAEKLDAAIQLIGAQSHGFGSQVALEIPDVAPLFWARPKTEAASLLKHLHDEGLTKDLNATYRSDVPITTRLTAKGWKRFYELTSRNAFGNRVFVAMHFTEAMNRVYDLAIEPAIKECGYQPCLISREQFDEKIDDRILAEIRRSALVIADCTGHRPNVYLEAGFAMALGIPVVWTCHESGVKDLHFDIRQHPCIGWPNEDDLRGRIIARIQALYPIKSSGT